MDYEKDFKEMVSTNIEEINEEVDFYVENDLEDEDKNTSILNKFLNFIK